jgi:hypothetical protein
MSAKHLGTYLNDHLSGSVVALELLGHLEAAYAGTAICPFLAELKADIVVDRQELDRLMTRLRIASSPPRKAAAWLAEKVSELKLRLDDPAAGALRLLEGLEALSLGIEGKRGLWLALAAAGEDSVCLQGPDYIRLEQRAADQRRRVENMRLQAAKEALGV